MLIFFLHVKRNFKLTFEFKHDKLRKHFKYCPKILFKTKKKLT